MTAEESSLPMAGSPRNWVSVLVCGLPLFLYLFVVVFWLLASASLGEWAQPNVNDPKGFLLGIPLTLATILMLVSFAIAPFALFLGYRRGRLGLHALAYGASLALSIVLFRMDLLRITTWIAD